jgi:hypothetical protein
MDYEKLWKRARAYGERNGLGSDAEDFAQECVAKAFEVGAVSLEYMFLNYRDYHRADKRILSGPTGKLSNFRTVSLDAPIDSSDEDSGKLSDLIGVPGADVDSRGELEFVDGILEQVLSKVRSEPARRWARQTYYQWMIDNVL